MTSSGSPATHGVHREQAVEVEASSCSRSLDGLLRGVEVVVGADGLRLHLLEPRSATEPMSSRRRFAYQTNDSRASVVRLSRCVGAQLTIVKQAARSLTNRADRLRARGDALAVDVDAPLELLGRRAHAERAAGRARARPSCGGRRGCPSRPTSAGAASGAASAARAGAASTSACPANSYSSLVQHPTMCSTRLLPHLARVVRDGCRSPPSRCASTSGRCRTRRVRRRSGRAPRPTRPSARGGCRASGARRTP